MSMSELPVVRVLWNGTMEVRVREATSASDGQSRALQFETDLGWRQAPIYPSNWAELSDTQLLGISDQIRD
jgi:hypothetical protein